MTRPVTTSEVLLERIAVGVERLIELLEPVVAVQAVTPEVEGSSSAAAAPAGSSENKPPARPRGKTQQRRRTT